MSERTESLTAYLLEHPTGDDFRLATVVAAAVEFDLKFTVSGAEKDHVESAMAILDAAVVEFIPVNRPDTWMLSASAPLALCGSEG
jgi:hypothetical protein